MIGLLRRHRYELIAFLTGASVMVLEIVGARLIAPHFGASTYVWTAMIGVILGALALGYAIGGALADRKDPRSSLMLILLFASFLTALTAITQTSVLSAIADLRLDVRLSALLAALTLFAPPSFAIGIVSPHLAKIRIQSLETSGRSVGRLEAAGAFGSIAGTFMCGYFLLGLVGSRRLVIGVALLLLLTSLLASHNRWLRSRFLFMVALFIVGWAAVLNSSNTLADIDTSYSRYRITQGNYGGRAAVLLQNDPQGIQSAVDTTQPRVPLFYYINRFDDAATNYGKAQRALVIGGGAFTFPSILAESDRSSSVDAVEIDPKLQQISKDFFYLSNSDKLRIITEDGRSFLNRNSTRYDTIFVDAYSSLTPPFQLSSIESVKAVNKSLLPSGCVVVNAIDSSDSPRFLAALTATYRAVFKHVTVYPASYGPWSSGGRQNFILYASNDSQTIRRVTANHQSSPFALPDAQVLTDDFAPVEQLLQ